MPAFEIRAFFLAAALLLKATGNDAQPAKDGFDPCDLCRVVATQPSEKNEIRNRRFLRLRNVNQGISSRDLCREYAGPARTHCQNFAAAYVPVWSSELASGDVPPAEYCDELSVCRAAVYHEPYVSSSGFCNTCTEVTQEAVRISQSVDKEAAADAVAVYTCTTLRTETRSVESCINEVSKGLAQSSETTEITAEEVCRLWGTCTSSGSWYSSSSSGGYYPAPYSGGPSWQTTPSYTPPVTPSPPRSPEYEPSPESAESTPVLPAKAPSSPPEAAPAATPSLPGQEAAEAEVYVPTETPTLQPAVFSPFEEIYPLEPPEEGPLLEPTYTPSPVAVPETTSPLESPFEEETAEASAPEPGAATALLPEYEGEPVAPPSPLYEEAITPPPATSASEEEPISPPPSYDSGQKIQLPAAPLPAYEDLPTAAPVAADTGFPALPPVPELVAVAPSVDQFEPEIQLGAATLAEPVSPPDYDDKFAFAISEAFADASDALVSPSGAEELSTGSLQQALFRQQAHTGRPVMVNSGAIPAVYAEKLMDEVDGDVEQYLDSLDGNPYHPRRIFSAREDLPTENDTSR